MTESDDGSPPEEPFRLSKQQLMDWSRTVVQIRACEALLRRLFDPKPESAFEIAHRIYRWEKVSALSHGYLVAAAEHLGLWADVIAPVQRNQDSVTQMRPHPYWLIGRASLETAARAVWLLQVRTPTECVQRCVRVLHQDAGYHVRALQAAGEDPSQIRRKIDVLNERCAELDIETDPSCSPPGFATMVGEAAVATDHDPQRWKYLWNVASGAGHGQSWFRTEGYDLLAYRVYEPGRAHTVSLPKVDLLTELINAACAALGAGVIRWLMLSGHGTGMFSQEVEEIAAHMSKPHETG